MDRALIGVAAVPIKQDLMLSDSQFGLLHGLAFAILYCLCGIPMGWLADRMQRRIVIACGLLLWTSMTAVCGLAHSFSVFFGARLGVGFGEACLLPSGMALIGSMTPRSRVARAVAIFLMGAIAGNALALLGGGYLLDHLGHGGRVTVPVIGHLSSWRLLFLLACVPGIMVAIAIMTIRETKQRTEFVFPWQALADARRHLHDHAQAYGFLTTATAAVLVLSQAQAA